MKIEFTDERKFFLNGKWIPWKDATPEQCADDAVDAAEYEIAIAPAGDVPEVLGGLRC